VDENPDQDAGALHDRLLDGDLGALAELFSQHRDRLWRMVNVRLDPRLCGRIDADDVLQEAYLDAQQRISHFRDDPGMSAFLWLRLITGQTLATVHRRHLGTKMRDARREVGGRATHPSPATSQAMAYQFAGHLTSPSQAAIKAELLDRVEAALQNMSDLDREILALRHFEDLTNREVADLLDIQPKAASIRYVRAIGRLRQVLKGVPGAPVE